MNLKKSLLLAAAAIASLAALTAPASASAAVWLHEGEPLAEHVEFELSGAEFIRIGGEESEDFVYCEVQATVTTTGGSSASITGYTLSGCKGVSGSVAGCTATSSSAVGLPWAVDVNSEDLTVTGVKTKVEFGSGCPIKELEMTAPSELTWTPFDEEGLPTTSSIALFEYQAEGAVAHVDGKATTYGNFGSLQFSAEESGTYGIG